MTPKLQAMLARVEELEADLEYAIAGRFSPRIIFFVERQAHEARAKYNRAVREEGERKAQP